MTAGTYLYNALSPCIRPRTSSKSNNFLDFYICCRTEYVQAKTRAKAEHMIKERGDYRPPEQLTVELNEARRVEK